MTELVALSAQRATFDLAGRVQVIELAGEHVPQRGDDVLGYLDLPVVVLDLLRDLGDRHGLSSGSPTSSTRSCRGRTDAAGTGAPRTTLVREPAGAAPRSVDASVLTAAERPAAEKELASLELSERLD